MTSYKDRGMMKVVGFLLTVNGVNPDKPGIVPRVISVLAFISTSLSVFMMILEIILNWNGVSTIEHLDFMPIFIVISVKLGILVTSQRSLRSLFGKLDSFWSTDKFTPEVKEECEKVFTFMRTFLFCYYMFGTSTIIVTVYTLFTQEVRALPNKGYDVCDYEQNNPCYFAMITWHLLLMYVQGGPSMLGFDFIFLAFAAYVYVASILLSAALHNMQLSTKTAALVTVKANFKEFVDQHNFVLDFVKETNDYCFLAFGVQLFCSLGSMTFCLYLLTVNGIPPDWAHMRYIQFFILFSYQFFVINLAASISKEKLIGIGDSAYDTEWSEVGEGQLRRDMSLIILRTQTGRGFSVASVFELDLNLFLTVFRTSFSIYTLLDQLNV